MLSTTLPCGKNAITVSAWIISDIFRTSVPVSTSGLLVLLTSRFKGELTRALSMVLCGKIMAAPRVSGLVAYLLAGSG